MYLIFTIMRKSKTKLVDDSPMIGGLSVKNFASRVSLSPLLLLFYKKSLIDNDSNFLLCVTADFIAISRNSVLIRRHEVWKAMNNDLIHSIIMRFLL